MPQNAKIATCCYCGTRSVLSFAAASGAASGPMQHELSCSSCGAALRNLKPIKLERREPAKARPSPRELERRRGQRPAKPKAKRRSKRRTPSFWRLVSEVFDEIEDIFD